MAQVKLLKIASDGVPLEFDSATDDITLNTFTANTAFLFADPTTGYINQTAGNLIADDIMAKERDNVMTTAGAVLFPLVTNTGAQLDSFKMPNIAGTPSATPSFSSTAGYMVYDSTNKRFYIWDGAAWDDQSTVSVANSVDNTYTAEVTIAARDVVYISSANNVSPALGDATSKSYVIGLAVTAASAAASVDVRSAGIMTGFAGLTTGARYYLSAATPGAITSTIPTGTGNTIVQVGYARSTSAVDIHIEQMGRRS